MKLLLRTQTELFASPAESPELISSERQKAIALLRALLIEAAIDQPSVPARRGEREVGND
jgi:hypothetical protein